MIKSQVCTGIKKLKKSTRAPLAGMAPLVQARRAPPFFPQCPSSFRT